RGAFAEIYANAGPPFKTGTNQEQFLKWMGAMSRKLGKFRSAEAQAWKVNSGSDGTTVLLGFNTHFENGPAEETFVWRVNEAEPTLVGYHINSPLFVADDLRTN